LLSGFLSALARAFRAYRHVERVFDPSRKDKHWDAGSWRGIDDGSTQVSRGFDPYGVAIGPFHPCPFHQRKKPPGRDAERLSHATAGPALLRFRRIYGQG
jgi:hypothetical protein